MCKKFGCFEANMLLENIRICGGKGEREYNSGIYFLRCLSLEAQSTNPDSKLP